MLTLKYNDLTDSRTLTSKLFDKRQREIEWLEAKLKRIKDFDEFHVPLSDEERISELEHEVRDLKRKNEILKKTLIMLAKDN